MSRLILLLVTVQVHQVFNTPLGLNEKQTHFKTSPNISPIVNPNHGDQKLPVLVPLVPSQHVTFVDTKMPNLRKKKGHNLPLSLPIPHQLLVPTNLHVIPIQHNNYHNTIHTGHTLITSNHVQLPIVSHTYTHSSSNVTHPTPLILIPIHTHLVPIHDLTVIPLHRPINNAKPKLSHYRAPMDNKDTDEEEPINKFRSFYGGYGNGLYIGGHGAGHGFYAYG